MQNENHIKNALLNRNIKGSTRQRNMQNLKEDQKEKNKENINRSQRVNSNHFVYCSKYSNLNNSTNIKREKEDNIKKSVITINNDDGLDHPNPLISDCEENLDDLKAQFLTKKDEYEILSKDLKRDKLNEIKNLIDTPGLYLSTTIGEATESNEKTVQTVKNSGIEENNTIRKSNILSKKNENHLSLKNNNEEQKKIKHNHKRNINNQQNNASNDINNNMNNSVKKVSINNSVNLNKKEKQQNRLSNNINKLKKEKEVKINDSNIFKDKKDNHEKLNTKKKKENNERVLESNGNNNDKNNVEKNNKQEKYSLSEKSKIKQELKINTIDNSAKKNEEINNKNALNEKTEITGNKTNIKENKKPNGKSGILNEIKKDFKINEKQIQEHTYLNSVEGGFDKCKNVQPNINNYNQKNNEEKQKLYSTNNLMIDYPRQQLINKVKCECPQMRKVLQKEGGKNNSNILINNTEPRINSLSPKEDKNFLFRGKNQINSLNTKDLIVPNEAHTIGSDRQYELCKINSYKISKNKNILNHMPNKSNNLSSINPNEFKLINLQKRNDIYNKHKSENMSHTKQRKKTFEKDGNFGNIQTTFVVISKNQKPKAVQKSKMSPEIIDYSKFKFKFINPTPSANFMNYSKLSKGQAQTISMYSPFTYDIRLRRGSVSANKKFGVTKSVNNLPVKYYDYNNVIVNQKNIYDTNYRNYIDSNLNTNSTRDLYGTNPGRNSYIINKSANNQNNKIQIFNDYDYNYNYDYGYNYNYDMSQIPNNSYIPYSNYNY